MEQFGRYLEEAANPSSPNYSAPAIVCSVINRDGRQLFLKAAGISGTSTKLDENSVFWLASQSKLITAIAGLQCVDKGLIGLDDDVAPVLPDLALLEVLVGTKDHYGRPVTRKRTKKITLRLLLSHQSGLGYDAMSPALQDWIKFNNIANYSLDSTLIASRVSPLIAEPGEEWNYGVGIDWAGILVERLTGLSLEEYMKKNIWEPLGMASTTFTPETYPDIHSRLVRTFERAADGSLSPAAKPPVPIPSPALVGGHGVYSTAKDYTKLLHALLLDGSSILSSKSTREIFSPQLVHPDNAKAFLEGPYASFLSPTVPKGVKVDHSLGGILALEDFPGGRAAGTAQWIGMPHLFWFADPKTGVAATCFMQLLPVPDEKAISVHKKFEAAVYAEFGTQRQKVL